VTTLTLYVGNDCVLELQTNDAINGTDLSGAAVTYDLKDDAATTVDSGAMTYIELSGGYYKFRATLADTLSITAGDSYTAVIDSDGGADKKGHWEAPVTAQTRTS